MTQDRSANERISAWLREEAPGQVPDRVLEATFEGIRHDRRRRAIPWWRYSPMTRSPAAIAVGATAVLFLAIGVAVLTTSGPSVGDRPSAVPSDSPAPSPESSSSPTLGPISLTGQVAFQQVIDGNADLYLQNLDRTGRVRLTDDPVVDWQPSWTPDGRTLVFTRRYTADPESADLFSLDIESMAQTQLTDLPGVEGDPYVSPDGTLIAYDHWPSEPGTYVMDIDGTDPRLIFTPPDDTYSLLGWTSDGTGLYMNRGGATLLRLDVATGDLSTITTGGDEGMRLSPDGTAFAFQEDGLFLMDVAGTNVRQVAGPWTGDGPVTWSPDGAHVALAHPDGWIYVVDVASGEMTRWMEGRTELEWRPSP